MGSKPFLTLLYFFTDSNCSNVADLRNIQKQFEKYCSSDINNFANSGPTASNFVFYFQITFQLVNLNKYLK